MVGSAFAVAPAFQGSVDQLDSLRPSGGVADRDVAEDQGCSRVR